MSIASIKKIFTTKLTRPDLSQYLYSRFIGDMHGAVNLHLVKDGSLGVSWEISIPAVESIADGEEVASNCLSLILRQFQPGYVFDIYTHRDDNIRGELRDFERYSASTGIGKIITDAQIKRWNDALKDGFFPNENYNFHPIRQRYILTMKKPSALVGAFSLSFKTALIAFFKGDSNAFLEEEVQEIVGQFDRDARAIEKAIAHVGLSSFRMDRDVYSEFVTSLLFSKRHLALPPAKLGEGDNIGTSIAAQGNVERIDDDGWVTRDAGGLTYHRFISMLWQPEDVTPGMCDALMNMGPGITVMANGRITPRMGTTIALKAQMFFASKMKVGFNNDEIDARMNDLREASSRLYEGENLVKVRYHVWVRGNTTREVVDRVSTVKSILGSKMEIAEENKLGRTMPVFMMPLSHQALSESFIKRDRRMLSDDFSCMMPTGGNWKGTSSSNNKDIFPPILYASRWGTPLNIQTNDCDSNPHFVVVGGSGSGKSFFIHDLVTQTKRTKKSKFYLISIKPDYKKLSSLYGKYLEITLDSNTSINPFGGEPNNNNLAFWLAVLISMLNSGNDTNSVTTEEQAVLSKAAAEASKKNWDFSKSCMIKETVLNDIGEELLEAGTIGKFLYTRLYNYLTGPYSSLFSGPASIDIDDDFVFFNLANIAEEMCAGVVTLCIFKFINKIMYDESYRGIPKYLLLDECWALMADKFSAAIVAKAFRAYRSLGGIAGAITQNLEDFDSPLGKAILNNTATKFILRQQENAILDLPKYIRFSKHELDMVRGLVLVKRRFSEFYVSMEGYPCTIGRVVPDPLKYAIATTDARDDEAINKIQNEIGDLSLEGRWKALHRFANEFPYGEAVQ